MTDRPRLLVVHHSPTRSVRALTDAVLAGAHDEALAGLGEADPAAPAASGADLPAASGGGVAAPPKFGHMSGAP